MAVIDRPLYGDEAHGPIKNAGSFYNRRGLPFFRSNTYRKDYERQAQHAQRNIFITAKNLWHELSQSQKDYWNSLAEWPHTGYSKFMSDKINELLSKPAIPVYGTTKYGTATYGG
jgi:hypothetical protein